MSAEAAPKQARGGTPASLAVSEPCAPARWSTRERNRLDKIRRALFRLGRSRESAKADSEACVLAERFVGVYLALDKREQLRQIGRYQVAERTRRDVLGRAFPDAKKAGASTAFERSRSSGK